MEPVTQWYMDQMKAPERQVTARVVIDYTDTTLDQSLKATTGDMGHISWPAQTADAVKMVPYKWTSLDGTWVFDGSWRLAPDTLDAANRYQMGWWGATLADEDGTFSAPYPVLTITCNSRPVHSLQVVGDSARGEYPVDFAIRLYGESDQLLHEELITGNTAVAWSKPLDQSVSSVIRMDLEIIRWSHPGRVVKITEFFTSVQQIYGAGDLLEINLLEEREVSRSSLPIGTISSNEITIRLSNDDRRFSADNEQSPLYQLLKPNRRIQAWLGVSAPEGGRQITKEYLATPAEYQSAIAVDWG